MLTSGMKKWIENFMLTECDDIIVDIMAQKLKVNIQRDGDFIEFVVTFSDKEIAKDRVNIK